MKHPRKAKPSSSDARAARSSRRITYTAASWLKQPGRPIWQQMWLDLLASRELAWRLMIKDISTQYRQSLLGVVWAFLPPIILAGGLTFAANTNIVNVAKTDIPYPAYVILSTALWQTFVEAMNSPMQAVSSSKMLMAKINFPREAVILSKLGQVFFNFGIKLILITAVFLAFRISVPWTIIIAPVALLHLIFLGVSIGLLLTPLSGLYSDIAKALGLITTPWMLLTPVIYPSPKSGLAATIVKLNPVTPLLVTTRELATTGVVSMATNFWIVSGLALIGLVIAWMLYRVAMPYVIERVSS